MKPEAPKWLIICGKIGRYLVILSIIEVTLFSLFGSTTYDQASGNDNLIEISRKAVYVNHFEYVAFIFTLMAAFVSVVIFLVGYFTSGVRLNGSDDPPR
jgi:hypothetical protein